MKKIILYIAFAIIFILTLVIAIVAMVDKNATDITSIIPAQQLLTVLLILIYFEIRRTKES